MHFMLFSVACIALFESILRFKEGSKFAFYCATSSVASSALLSLPLM